MTNNCIGCGQSTDNPKFCTKSCAAAYNNKNRIKKKKPLCLVCNIEVKEKQRKYCSRSCARLASSSNWVNNVPEGSRRCSKCKEIFPVEEVNKSYCKQCRSNYFKKWQSQDDNRSQKIRRVAWKKERVKEARKFIIEFLEENQCVDCGYSNPRALEFDHVETGKILGIFRLAASGVDIATLKEEISKCEVRCANCHKIATQILQNWWWVEVEMGFEPT